MRKEQITDKEGICILFFFFTGSTLILGIARSAKSDAWLSGIAGLLMALPMIFVYARILSIFPGKDLFEILEMSTGKIAGKVISLIYVWYSFHLGAMILRNFGEFINIAKMPETPIIVPMFMLGIVCIISVKLGIEVISKFCTYALPLILLIIVIILLLGLRDWELTNFKPVMHHNFTIVMAGGFSVFSFPFAESVLLMGLFHALKTRKSTYKVYFFATVFAGITIIVLAIRNIAVLGEMYTMLSFPSYIAVGRISIGEFFQRLEITVSIVFLIGVFIKSSLCLLVACRGITHVFGLSDYSSVAIQLGLLMILFSYTVYSTVMEMNYWAFKVYEYYAFPMQVILPLILWIFAEIRYRKLQADKAIA